VKWVVLDASAMLAFLRGEPGCEHVLASLLSDEVNCIAHAINACEVYYDILRSEGESAADAALSKLEASGVEIRSDMDARFWKGVARRKARGRISLADCCGLALTEAVNGEFHSTDHHELDDLALMGEVKIVFIR
jgi:PIN domain nuclease of toxin-antitoxin system